MDPGMGEGRENKVKITAASLKEKNFVSATANTHTIFS